MWGKGPARKLSVCLGMSGSSGTLDMGMVSTDRGTSPDSLALCPYIGCPRPPSPDPAPASAVLLARESARRSAWCVSAV